MPPNSSWSKLIAAPPTGTTPVSMPMVVAYNLKSARHKRGYNQAELGARLGEVTGNAWSAALVSAAEAGWAGKTGRVRNFDVEDLIGFSLALQLPMAWFLMPPPRTPTGAVVPSDQAWLLTNKEIGKACVSSDLLSFVALAHNDPDDPDDLMGRRVWSEADHVVEPPPTPHRNRTLRHDLLKLLDKYQEDK